MKQAFSKPLILIFFAIFAAGGILAWQYFGVQKPIACTEEAKICPDGSAVGRIGPNCEFAACPAVSPNETADQLPRFEDFPALERFEGVFVPPDFSSNSDALKFVTRITDGARGGPNFAGQYTIIEWGCGTECQSGAMVDSKTGTIFWVPWSGLGRDFRIDSYLLIVNPPDYIYEVHGNEIPDWLYTQYYKWENDQFVLIYEYKPKFATGETADWKTYKNKEYGFEIKYPEDLTVDVSSIELINARNGENPFNLKLEGDTDVIYLRLFKRSNPACKQVVKLKEYITCEYSALSYPENQINEFSEKKIGDNTFVYADFEGIEHPNVNFRAIWAFIDSGDLIYKFDYLWDKDSIKPFQQELINKIISTLRFIDRKSQKIAADFCNKNRMYGGTVSYSSPLNFDQDKDEEILLVCGDYPEDEVIMMYDKNFFILDRQNQDYKLIWQGEMPKDFYRDLYIYEISKPKINDVEKDGIDEIFFKGYVWGGTCTGSSDFYFLYSIKYNELFYLEEGSWFDSSCTYTQISTTTSANLELEKYKVFRDFLEQKYNKDAKL